MTSADSPSTRLATRLSFLVAGFGIACWAPLVPFAKARLGIGDAELGLLLLCIGLGSIAAMAATGPLSARHGSRPVILAGGIGLALVLPFLAVAPTPLALGAALLLFGAALGSIDVAMNVHAVEVERDAGRPLMSGFHALFSVGGAAGSSLLTALLSAGADALAGTLAASAVMLAAMAVAWPRLMMARAAEAGPLFVAPQGIVLLIAGLCAATFLTEGAMLDWGALLISGKGLVAPDRGGVGYLLFSAAMTAGRLGGDRLTARIGDRATLVGGGLLAVLGFAVLLAVPVAPVALSGFALIGFGAANMVPVFFRVAGAQTVMPRALAVGAITTTGYAGILAGPAAIGFVAQATGLPAAFWMLAALIALVPLTAGMVAGARR